MRKIFMFLFISMFLISVVSAEESFIFKNGQQATLEIAMSNNDLSTCDTCTCEVSLFYPNGSAFVRNGGGANVDGYCQYNFTPNTLGIYGGELIATNGADSGRATFEFEVNYTGENFNLQSALLQLGFVAFLIFFLLFVLFSIPRLPNSNNKSDDNIVVSINKLKYLRPVLYAISWGLLLAIMFIVSNVAIAYLPMGMFGEFLFTLFRIMFLMTLPMVVIWLIYIFYSIFQDKEMKKLIERGIEVRTP